MIRRPPRSTLFPYTTLFRAVNVDQNNRNALPASIAQLAQGSIKLIHEVAAVRQPGEGVVVAGMLEAPLQRLVLLDLGAEAIVDRVQPFARLRERALRAVEARRQLVRAEHQRPGEQKEETRPAHQVARRVPARPRPQRELQVG